MKITMVDVTSVNGKITRGDETQIYKWTSKEDGKFFSSLMKKNNLMIMGSKTYEAAKQYMALNNGILRIVLTKSPDKYISSVVPGQLEFSDESPKILLDRLDQKGYKKLLLLGGSHINALFLNAGLVDELFLTLEPKIFGSGKSLVPEDDSETLLSLVSFKKLNKQGTLLLHYKVAK